MQKGDSGESWGCPVRYVQVSCLNDESGAYPSAFPYSLVARIERSHRSGPGSIPGGGEFLRILSFEDGRLDY